MDEALFAIGVGSFVALYARRRATRVEARALGSTTHAICVLDPSASPGVSGTIECKAVGGGRTQFRCALEGLSPGLHGFHVHRSGDLRGGCESACAHYNPTGVSHGAARGANRHRGDIGNIEADASGTCTTVVVADVTLDEIVGRMLVVHADPDDLGQGENEESRKTGNAGRRIACGVIGRVG